MRTRTGEVWETTHCDLMKLTVVDVLTCNAKFNSSLRFSNVVMKPASRAFQPVALRNRTTTFCLPIASRATGQTVRGSSRPQEYTTGRTIVALIDVLLHIIANRLHPAQQRLTIGCRPLLISTNAFEPRETSVKVGA
jgi:hypothetical protein